MSSEAPAPNSSETLIKATDPPHTNSTISTMARRQGNEMLIATPSTSITTYGTTPGKSASAPDLMSHITDLFSPASSRNYSITNTTTSNSDPNLLGLSLNADSFLTTSSVSDSIYNFASISPVSTDLSAMSLISAAALETYIHPVTPSILSDISVNEVIEHNLLSSISSNIVMAKLENGELETVETSTEYNQGTDTDYADASTSTLHITSTEAATDPIDIESNSAILITETIITSRPAATNLTIAPIVTIIAVESAYIVKLLTYDTSKEVLVTDLTKSSSARMMIPIKISPEISTETVTPETISLAATAATNMSNISATNIATHLLLSILSKVTSKLNVETIPMSITATNNPVNFIATNLVNQDSNNQPSVSLTFNEDVATFSQSTTSMEISNQVDYIKATEHAENGAGKQVRFTNSTVSANSNVKHY